MEAPLKFHSDVTEVSDEALANLYEAAGFGSADMYLANRDFAQRVFPNRVFGFFAQDKVTRGLVGMARVMSDDYICSWICELCVDPAARSRGVASTLLQNVLDRFGHTAVYTEAFAEHVDLFKRAGIKPKAKLIACSRAGDAKAPVREPEPFVH